MYLNITNEQKNHNLNILKDVIDIIRGFIKEKKRKIYGNIAINEIIKSKNPDDSFLGDDSICSYIEFYSPSPIDDLVKLTNLLYEKGYKYPIGSDAPYEETYSIFIDYLLCCNITYVPIKIYRGIKSIIINEINYADPHFLLIDQLKNVNKSLAFHKTNINQFQEITFEYVSKLLKYYPLEYFDKLLQMPKPFDDIDLCINKIKNIFLNLNKIRKSCLICGFDAYNFYIKSAIYLIFC